MAWLELRVQTSDENASTLEPVLEETGALAVTYTDAGDQAIFEPELGEMPLWANVTLVALYDSQVNTEEIEANIRGRLEAGRAVFQWNPLEDRVWEREWLKHQTPIKFGESFWVYHEHMVGDLPTLLLDPGLAFGTGSHPTTALCLEWIAAQKCSKQTVLDYGCGSGILAVAAMLLGAEHAHCVDIDQQALDATRNNAQRNMISSNKLGTYLPNAEPDEKYDFVFANILYEPLLSLAPKLAEKTKTGGYLCLSGILHTQMEGIIDRYHMWFDEFDTSTSKDWGRIVAKRNLQPAKIS